MGGACGTHGEMRIKFWSGKLMGRNEFGNTDINRIIITCLLK